MILNIPGFLLPLTIIAICTFQIIRVLLNNTMQKFKETPTEQKASTLMLVVLLSFIVCWLPFQIVTFLDTLFIYKILSGCTIDHLISIGNQISTYLAYSNSCLNPLLYVIVGNNFRKKAREVYEQWLSRGQRRPSTSTIVQTDFTLDTGRTSISMERPKKEDRFLECVDFANMKLFFSILVGAMASLFLLVWHLLPHTRCTPSRALQNL